MIIVFIVWLMLLASLLLLFVLHENQAWSICEMIQNGFCVWVAIDGHNEIHGFNAIVEMCHTFESYYRSTDTHKTQNFYLFADSFRRFILSSIKFIHLFCGCECVSGGVPIWCRRILTWVIKMNVEHGWAWPLEDVDVTANDDKRARREQTKALTRHTNHYQTKQIDTTMPLLLLLLPSVCFFARGIFRKRIHTFVPLTFVFIRHWIGWIGFRKWSVAIDKHT